MSSFEDRKKSFEKKFAHDQELQFKVSARRNKYLGEWVSQILNFNSDQEKEYIQSVITAFPEIIFRLVFKENELFIFNRIKKKLTKISFSFFI